MHLPELGGAEPAGDDGHLNLMGYGSGLLVDVVGTGVGDVVGVGLLVVAVVGSLPASWADMYPSGVYKMVPSG
jgi:hypothetical protein